jgi:Cd2+/Zn2+-exporting ATPase
MANRHEHQHAHDHGHTHEADACCAGAACASVALPFRAETAPLGSRSVRYAIDKMDCPTEERLIRNKLERLPGITRLDFNLVQRELTVHHTLAGEAAIVAALEALDMAPRELAADQSAKPQAGLAMAAKTRWLMALSGTCAVAAEGAAWTSGDENSLLVIALAALSIAAGGLPTLKKGWIALRNLSLNINFLMSLAVLGAMVIGKWPEAAMVIFLFGVAEIIEALSLDRARNAIQKLMAMTPELATVKQPDGSWQSVAAANVSVGQIVKVRPGERIPLDGVLTLGHSTVNQAPITGESMPLAKQIGDAVFAGTLNETGAFEFRVTANQGNTTLARIIKAVQAAQSQRAPTQRFIDTFSRFYTPSVVIFALLLAAVPPLVLHAAWQPWFYQALVLLVIACPCALVISTPVTVVSGLAAAARHGILIKGGQYLEEGHKLRAIALDKTGTLTVGKPRLTDLVAMGEHSEADLLHIAASLDEHSEHPVAHAIVQGWRQTKDGGAMLAVTAFQALTGRGVRGDIAGNTYYLGNHRLVEELAICNPALETRLQALEQQGKTAVVLCDSHTPLAIFAVADTIKNSTASAIQRLIELGVHPVMLTGDNQLTATAIGNLAGIEDARGNLLPEDKLEAIAALQIQHGHVGMVGDGINDSPALARANIGFAMGAAGTDTALETADVALMDDDLHKVADFILLSRQTARILAQNITLALGIKVVFFGLALTGMATLWMAVFADMGASLLVVFNGLRLLHAFNGKKRDIYENYNINSYP